MSSWSARFFWLVMLGLFTFFSLRLWPLVLVHEVTLGSAVAIGFVALASLLWVGVALHGVVRG
jgi:hypothetical protein